jgi:hypothetical protein
MVYNYLYLFLFYFIVLIVRTQDQNEQTRIGTTREQGLWNWLTRWMIRTIERESYW